MRGRPTVKLAIFAIALAWVAAGLLAGIPRAHAADPPTVALIFDGSGSMWGRLGTEANSKLAMARDAVRQSLTTIDRNTLVGLTSFGHRRVGDCTDVELVLPPAPVDADRISAPLLKLNPKGRGPIGLALRRTAQALPGNGPESIVLIHDDPDNCQDDPCAAAAEIHRVKPRLAIHVISLGLKPEDVERMSCVAKATGGKWFDVQASASMPGAVTEALRLASLDAPATSLQVPAPRPAVRPTDSGPPGLRPSAVLSPGADALDAPVKWRVWRGPTAEGSPVAEASEPFPSIALTPGTYTVEGQIGLASGRHTVEVAGERPTRLALPLNAGIVQLAASIFKEDATSPTAVLSLAEVAAPGSGSGDRVLWVGPAQPTELVIPAGTYKVVLQDRQFRAEKAIVVPAGSQGTATIAPQAGRLRVRVHDQNGENAGGLVLCTVLEDDPAAPSGRREVARSAARNAEFMLPAGTYHVAARRGAAEVREVVALAAGDDIARTLVLGTARLSLSTRLTSRPDSTGVQAAYRVVRSDDKTEVARADGPAFDIELPPGRYAVESRVGDQNAVATREIEMKVGADQSLVLNPAAAPVQLKLSGAPPALAAPEIFWEVQDAAGRTVWRTIGSEPQGVLAGGRYTARLEIRERRVEKPFEVRPGEATTVELGAE
jgi:Ca-activated chloride channel family protein